MEKVQPQVAPKWVRRQWDEAAEQELGGLLGFNKAEVMQDVAAGLAYLFQLIAEQYAGWLLFSIKEINGELLCFVYAFKGEHTEAALADLEKLAAAQGCKRVVIVAETAGHVRLYKKTGFSMAYCEMSKSL